MTLTRKTTSATVLGLAAIALTLTACTPSSTPSSAATASSPSASSSETASASATSTDSGSPTPSSSPSSPSTEPSSPASSPVTSAVASASPTTEPTPTTAPSTPPTAGATALCTAARLNGSVAPLPGGGTAGSVYTAITVRNVSGAPCRLSGYPGVSFVGGGNGTQIGVPADRDTTQAPVDLTLAPGQTAQARLQIVQAGNYGQVCNPKPADGIRVYPPSATDALFLPYSVTACGNPKIILAHVGAFQHSL